jgi:hypothetical protein
MNGALDSTNTERDRASSLLTLHKQANFWGSYNHKYVPWTFFVVNNGNLPNCEKVQQLRCSICFPHVVPVFLIGRGKKRKKDIITYNTLFGTSVMKRHVVHFNILSF